MLFGRGREIAPAEVQPRIEGFGVHAAIDPRVRRERGSDALAVERTGVEGGQTVDAVEVASRGFLGTVFIILMFITILIYGMWVATGVASEKSSSSMKYVAQPGSMTCMWMCCGSPPG